MNHARRSSRTKRIVLLLFVLVFAAGLVFARRWLDPAVLVAQEQAFREFHSRQPWLVFAAAFVLYVTVTGLSIPGATVLTLLYAWLFGFWPTLVLVSFASTTGAWLAFLISRYFLRDYVTERFGVRLRTVEKSLDRDGVFYLFTLRLLPVVPFWLVNLLMGLTSIRARTFWWVSQLGMLPGTCVYVFAGSRVPNLNALESPKSLLGWDVLAALLALGVFPWLVRWVLRVVRPATS